jgi:hypothetical protein
MALKLRGVSGGAEFVTALSSFFAQNMTNFVSGFLYDLLA